MVASHAVTISVGKLIIPRPNFRVPPQSAPQRCPMQMCAVGVEEGHATQVPSAEPLRDALHGRIRLGKLHPDIATRIICLHLSENRRATRVEVD